MNRGLDTTIPAKEAVVTVVDFESTGSVDGHPNEPWQIGMVALRHGRIDIEGAFSSLLRVGNRPFSPYAPGNYHRQREAIASAPTLTALWPSLKSWWLNRPLAAHNAATEKKFITETAPLHRVGPWIDTLKLARCLRPELPSHKLEDLLDLFELTPRVRDLCPGLDPHDALFDAVGSAAIIELVLAQDGGNQISLAALTQARPQAYHRLVRERRATYTAGKR